MEQAARLLVTVETANGDPVPRFTAELTAVGSETTQTLAATETSGQAYAESLPAGIYEIRVSARKGNLQPESRTVQLAPGINSARFILGRDGQPFYYAGDLKVYFEPDNDTLLLVTRGERASDVTASVLRKSNLRSEPLPPILASGGEESPAQQPSDTSYVSITLPGDQSTEETAKIFAEVVKELEGRGLQAIPALPVRRGDLPVQGLTNELVVRFDESVTREEVDRIAEQFGLTVERPILYAGNAYLLSRPGLPSYELLDIAETLRTSFPVLYAEPNLLMQLEIDQFTPNDTLWANLTHLPLIECDDAWQTLGAINLAIRGGRADLTIAVFDPHGVAPNHPDLTANLTDGTSKLVTSFNFSAMAAQTVAGLGGDHGTQCAGSAAAAFNNNLGTAGVAPNCHLIGARLPSPATGIAMADAFIWSAGFNTGATAAGFPALPARNADVISNSWGSSGAALSSALRDCFDFLTIYGRGGRGCIVTFSVGNLGYMQFSTIRTFAAYERTLAVGASINVNPTTPVNSANADPNGNTNNLAAVVDTRAFYSPFGPEMDIVAPSHTAYPLGGGAVIDPTTSTVRVGTGNLDGCPGAPVCNDYSAAFGGTSHSSPTIAGTAALVLSVNPSLSWVEVREFLRDTAVRIDFGNVNAIGQWVDNDGDGVREFSQWYGYGRVDVNAAVVAVRDSTLAADIVVRENLADDGSVPSGGWHAHSPDIWVRRTDDPIPALAYTADPPHQSPRRGQNNYVFCRVRNRGTAPSNEVYIRAMITHFPGFEFRYPQEFIPTNRPGDPVPSPLTPGTYLIGETRIDNLAATADRIVKMTWPTALIPPATVLVGGVSVAWHPCLLIEASPHDGPLPAGSAFDIKRDNNIAQRNITILEPGDPATDLYSGVLAGTSHGRGIRALVIDRSRLDDEVRVFVRLADPELMETFLANAKELAAGAREREPAVEKNGLGIRLLSRSRLAIESAGRGTLLMEAPAGTRLTYLATRPDASPALTIGSHLGLDAVEVGAGSDTVEIPLRLAEDQFAMLMFALETNGSSGKGELRLTQRRGDEELSAGYSVFV